MTRVVRGFQRIMLAAGMVACFTFNIVMAQSNEQLLDYCRAYDWVQENKPLHFESVNAPGFQSAMQKIVESGLCSGFLQSARQATEFRFLYPSMDVCIPFDVTIKQLSAIYIRFIAENPTRWHEEALAALLESWRLSFPCD